MPRRHPELPTIWLMTDERQGAALWRALAALPRGAGVVFRHYATVDRAALLARIERIARRRGLVVVAADVRASGGRHQGRRVAHSGRRARGLLTHSAHRRSEIVTAIRARADAVFVSPIFATRSHPGAPTLGPVRLGLMIRGLRIPVVALGGMTAHRAGTLRRIGIHGWAAIDALTHQKRKAVPT